MTINWGQVAKTAALVTVLSVVPDIIIFAIINLGAPKKGRR
jgi:hypothetical protein